MQPTIIRAKVATPPKAPRKMGRDDKCPPEASLFVTEDEVLIELLMEVLVLKEEELAGLLELSDTELVTDGGATEVTTIAVGEKGELEEAGGEGEEKEEVEEEGKSEGELSDTDDIDATGAVDECEVGINDDEQF